MHSGDSMATLADLQTQLAEIDQAIRDAVQTGSQYSITGSHAVTQQTLSELNKQRTRITHRILRVKGLAGPTRPSYGSATTVPTAPMS